MKYSQKRKQAVLARLAPLGDTDAQMLAKALEEPARAPLPGVSRH